MAKLMIVATRSYLCMCRSMIKTMEDGGFILDKPKSQAQACDQRLTATMVAGQCFSGEGKDVHMDCNASHGGGRTKVALHVVELIVFGLGQEEQHG